MVHRSDCPRSLSLPRCAAARDAPRLLVSRRHIRRRAILRDARASRPADRRAAGPQVARRRPDGRPRVGPRVQTDAGVRQVDMLPALRDELLELKATSRRTGPNDLVFATSAANLMNASTIRNRVPAAAVKLADARLVKDGDVPLPERLTPHKLRDMFASVRVAIVVDPGSVMDQLGHTDPGFTLRVYRHGMRRDEASAKALRDSHGSPVNAGLSEDGHGWARPSDLSRVKRGRIDHGTVRRPCKCVEVRPRHRARSSADLRTGLLGLRRGVARGVNHENGGERRLGRHLPRVCRRVIEGSCGRSVTP